jgi:hypothetical protein
MGNSEPAIHFELYRHPDSRARYRRQRGTPHPHPPPFKFPPSLTQHLHHHTSRGHCQTPGFLVRDFPPWLAAGVHNPLILSHASCHQLTRLIVHWQSWTPAIYPHGRRSPSEPIRRQTRSSPPPAVAPRCWNHLAFLPDTRPGVPPRCCSRGGRIFLQLMAA